MESDPIDLSLYREVAQRPHADGADFTDSAEDLCQASVSRESSTCPRRGRIRVFCRNPRNPRQVFFRVQRERAVMG